MARKANSKTRRGNKSKRKNGRKSAQRRRAKETNADHFRKMLDWFLPNDGIFGHLKLHGNTSWLPRTLVCLALCWSWAENKCVTDSFTYGVEWCRCLTSGSVLTTYQGMMNALIRWTEPLMQILQGVMHKKMKQIGGEFWEIAGWVAIAFDGSRDSAPRTKANEEAFCAPNYGQGKRAKYGKKKSKGMRRRKNEKNKSQPPIPQVWITLMWHVGLRLPWTWRLGPSNSSERDHVKEMIRNETFPKNTLFCGDAGFIGYPLWSLIMNSGFDLLVRVGGNVSLLSEQGFTVLKHNMTVLSWPKDAIKAGGRPLKLRLVRVKVGKADMWLLTSVLDKSKLNQKQIRDVYAGRWGIEVEFRGLKQTLDKAKLRCRTEERVKAELHWSLMAMAIAELFALKEQLKLRRRSGPSPERVENPKKRSLAQTVRALRYCLTHLQDVPETGAKLPKKLQQAVTDSYDHTAGKAARYKPPNPDKKPLGEPRIRKLNIDEKKKLKAISSNELVV